MNADTTLDIEALHDAVESDIKAAFPGLKTVEFYPEDRKGLTAAQLPALILDLSEFEGAEELDPGTEQLAVTARFEAQIIMGYRVPRVKREMRKFAAAFAAWLRLRRWTGVRTGPVTVIGCFPDDFDPELDRFEVWRVEWTQTLHLGNTVWNETGTPPTMVFAGVSPDIGAGNEDDYTQVTP